MAQKLLHVTVARVDGPVFNGEVISLTVPGSEGEMTLLADHVPLISVLKKGVVTVRKSDNGEESFPIERGTLEVSRNQATVLI